MTNLKLKDETAKKLFSVSDSVLKDILIDTFGEDFFKGSKFKLYTDLKTFEDCCEVMGEDPNHSKFCSGTSDEIAYKMLKVVTAALNKLADPTWICDWNNSNQTKWSPWFWMNQPGFRLGASGYDYAPARTGGGSRLRLCSEKVSNYAGTQFLSLYSQYLN